MATFNIPTTITSGSYHKRSTGPTGQVLASAEIEAKLARVEALYREVYGVPMGRMKFYDLVLEIARRQGRCRRLPAVHGAGRSRHCAGAYAQGAWQAGSPQEAA